MKCDLFVRHCGGSAAHPAGAVQEFGHGRIRIGRGADCELRFDSAADLAVSTMHAEIVADGDRVTIVDLDSRNGVFVNDVRVAGDTQLAPGDVVRFGADGPQFAVEFGAAAETRNATSGKKSVGMSTLMGVVGKSVERERRRNRQVMLPIIALPVAVVFGLIFWTGDDAPQWRDTLAEPTKSVYVCAMMTGGNAKPFGTAWSLGDGWLATNSHVAIEFETMRTDQQFLVRSCSTPPQDLRVVKVTLHPGYRRWAELVSKYDPYVPGQGFQRGLPPAFDVAVLEVHPDDVALLAPGLPIANRTELLGLNPGDAVALVGYPMEGQAGFGINMGAPYPQLRAGTVSRTTNFFVGTDKASKRRLVGLSLSSAGGASGSPVFDRLGRVVAINSAGDYLDVGIEGRRVKSGGAYGQRADILMDLVEGRAQGADAQTARALEQEFITRFREGVAEPDTFAFWLATQALNAGESLGEPYKAEFKIEKGGPGGAVTLAGFAAKNGGDHIRVIVPTSEPVPPIVSTSLLGAFQPNPTACYFLLTRDKLTKGMKIQTKVEVAADAIAASPVGYVLYWYPVTP